MKKISAIVGIMLFIICFQFPLCSAQVTITPDSVEASPGDIGVDIGICLDNPDNLVGSVQLDLCEYTMEGDPVDAMECMDCKLTERTTVFDCEVLELPNGCCRVLLFCQSPDCSIDTDLCDVATVVYKMFELSEVYIGTPCVVKIPVNMVVSDNEGLELEATGLEGEVCFPDADQDGFPDKWDNCHNTPNGPNLGTCYSWSGMAGGTICMGDDGCGGLSGSCSMNQEDTYPPQGNGIGDVCDCEADFNCDGNVDAADVYVLLTDFGRNEYNDPCEQGNQCNGDFDCNSAVDATDVTKFLADFGRNAYNNPCPACEVGDWCVYEVSKRSSVVGQI
jgi:hypothetical protein